LKEQDCNARAATMIRINRMMIFIEKHLLGGGAII